ncbi:MAG TPA: glycosyltransferase family 2 protein [Lacipirellulaceae bacterium]|nr:glycosyltransferase family 2 protein [Lacipirellulaceae bacterium]
MYMTSIAAILIDNGMGQSAPVLERLATSQQIRSVALAGAPSANVTAVHRLRATSLRPAAAIVETLRWFETTDVSHLLCVMSPRVEITANGLRRLTNVAADTRAAIVYSDFFDAAPNGAATLHPLIDCQPGSIRDDFDFGQALLISRAAANGLADAIEAERAATAFGGWYDLRLRLTERGPVVHMSEPTYSVAAAVEHSAGDSHFSYVDPRNRNYQIEMELIATAHLKRIGAWLPPPNTQLIDDKTSFPVECSVVVPVRNRAKTVADAVSSALSQETDFPFNVIVVDNHSTDGTSDVLRNLAAKSDRLVHLIPTRRDLGIGGCWNEAIYHEKCGRYAVQLDSDDLYASPGVLTHIVGEFQRGPYAAIIGSYTIVDFNLQPIPPGLIDHREWTAENGHNNALRIAGLGAPRAFHVPTLRTIGFPNVSYGEDYAVALRISRQYQIGRIYDSLYWCRRWEGNSDHALSIETQNRYAFYKDRLRSTEVAARQQLSDIR